MKKKWNTDLRYNECLEKSFDTFTDLLAEENNIDRNEMNSLETEFREKMDKASVEYKTAEEVLAKYAPLHSYQYDGDEEHQNYGVIVIVESQGKSLIIDGNHRVSTWKEKNPSLSMAVIVIKISQPLTRMV